MKHAYYEENDFMYEFIQYFSKKGNNIIISDEINKPYKYKIFCAYKFRFSFI